MPVVEIYSDRLTITSYGGLPPGLSQESFFRGCSMSRNRELMRIFKDVSLVESLGSGMGKILEAYDQSIFTFLDTFLIVTFPFAEGFTLPHGNDSGNDNGIINKEELKAKILHFIQKHPDFTLDKISENTGFSKRTISRYTKEFQETGILKRVGSDRSGYWEVYPNEET